MSSKTIQWMNVSAAEGSVPEEFNFVFNARDYSESGDGVEVYGETTDVFLIVMRILVCVFGVFGNAVVIFVILVLREYRKAVTHWYILHLALADSLFLLTLPLKVVEDIRGEWIFPAGLCKAKEALLFCNYYSSILFLVVMSVDRYFAICHGLSKNLRKLRTKRAAYAITVAVWTTSLLLCIPVILYSDKRGLDPNCKCHYEFPNPLLTPEELCNNDGLQSDEDCIAGKKVLAEEVCHKQDLNPYHEILQYEVNKELHLTTVVSPEDGIDTTISDDNQAEIYEMSCSYAMHSNGWVAYVCFNFLVMFIIPFTIISTCYCCIIIRVKQTRRRRRSVSSESSLGAQITSPGKLQRIRRKSSASTKVDNDCVRITSVCLILVLLFMVCWLPFHAVHLAKIKGVKGSVDFCTKLSAVSALIAYLNSALNPWVYNFVSRGFERRLRSAADSIKRSLQNRHSYLSSGGSVRYHVKRHSSALTSTNGGIVMTKIYRGRGVYNQEPPSYENVVHAQEPLVQN